MGLIAKLKEKFNKWYYHEPDLEENWDDEEPANEEKAFEDADVRTVYVLEALGRMAEAADKMEQCQDEYSAVTSLLVDMEEIEGLPGDVRGLISDQATKIANLEKERRSIYAETGKLSEARMQFLERYEDDIPGGIKKMREAEEYRKLVKMDMRKLEAEKSSYKLQMHETKGTIQNSRGIALICGIAMFFSIILLLFLQLGMDMDVAIGYIIICGAGALALTVIFVRYQDAVREMKRLEKLRNKLTGVHNTVKIRYVNNTNLLSYLYMKYDVDSADDLETEWEIYAEEVGARARDEKLREELEYYYDKLTKTLRDQSIKDPEIWTKQTGALIDSREMVEVRHALIGRRQKLRERMEYNKEVAEVSQRKIKDLAQKYPQYSQEIAGILNRFEGS
ncbi:MAG: hypothetical protein K6B44_13460 [Lachnospiraceae bacterium]|nr:hypothetical protein [Lachnospiraceae bacterium]